MAPNYRGGAVLFGNQGVLILDGGDKFELNTALDFRRINGALLLKNRIVVFQLGGGDSFEYYLGDRKILESRGFAPPTGMGVKMLIKIDAGWGLYDENLNLVRQVADRNYRDLSGDNWACYEKDGRWGFFNIHDQTDVAAEFMVASFVRNGFCVVAKKHREFYAVTLGQDGFKIQGGPFDGGGAWISGNGTYAVVKDLESGKNGVIDRSGGYVVPPEYDEWFVFNDSSVFLKMDGDSHWHQFADGRTHQTKIRADSKVMDLGFDDLFAIETSDHVGYVNGNWKEIFQIEKSTTSEPATIR
ncbi:MAG: hypothetical protein K9N23_16765 [Akkermansiaceae bacterium]|nr:hypothetical protein [Akkermansiaceae bacterium]MCF7733344.1 hypothetical protein [Akkermansiaceae bacterium]